MPCARPPPTAAAPGHPAPATPALAPSDIARARAQAKMYQVSVEDGADGRTVDVHFKDDFAQGVHLRDVLKKVHAPATAAETHGAR